MLRGTATLRLRPTEHLSSLTLDLHRLRVGDVTVGGESVRWRRRGDELRIAPPTALLTGRTYRLTVTYAGRPNTYTDPDGSSEGWFRTDDGSVSVNEPVGAMTWFPVNNTPRDKATYRVAVTVPRGLTAVSNGDLVREVTVRDRTRWVWRTRDQLASFLTTVAVGRFETTRGTARDGTRLWSFVDPRFEGDAVARLRPVMAFLARRFGPYPFTSSGLIIDRADIGYALEVQNRPVFTGDPGDGLLVHEIAHQWYGNSVTARLVRHLAQRGLRDVRGVDVGRPDRPPVRRRSTSTGSAASPPSARCGAHPRPTRAARRTSSRTPSTTAAR